MAALCRAGIAGDVAEARRLHERYLALMRVNFITVNPVPVKAALASMGLIENVVRGPLLPASEAHLAQVESTLRDAGVTGVLATAGR
jgi:dihydrodipicolinate synthase/N-acetylneuraminate lyase